MRWNATPLFRLRVCVATGVSRACGSVRFLPHQRFLRALVAFAGPVFAGIALDFAAAMIDVGSREGVAALIAEAATHTQPATFDSNLVAFLKARYLQRQGRHFKRGRRSFDSDAVRFALRI